LLIVLVLLVIDDTEYWFYKVNECNFQAATKKADLKNRQKSGTLTIRVCMMMWMLWGSLCFQYPF